MSTAVQLDLRGTALVDFYINQGHSFKVEMDHFEQDGTTPLPLTGTFKMTINDKIDSVTPVMTLTAGDGLTVVDNKLTIQRSAAQNSLPSGILYYDIRVDHGDNTSVKMYEGRIHISPVITA
jgi:hypothetical protein